MGWLERLATPPAHSDGTEQYKRPNACQYIYSLHTQKASEDFVGPASCRSSPVHPRCDVLGALAEEATKRRHVGSQCLNIHKQRHLLPKPFKTRQTTAYYGHLDAIKPDTQEFIAGDDLFLYLELFARPKTGLLLHQNTSARKR